MNIIYSRNFATLVKGLIFTLMLVGGVSLMAQDFVATGRVVDSNGEPLAGASVNVSEQNRLSYSDRDGNFVVRKVNNNDDIIVSLSGYKSAAVTIDMTTQELVVVLESLGGKYDKYIDMPYSRVKLKNLGASTSTMTGQELEKHPVNELQNAFMGSLTGVITFEERSEPGTSTSQMYIRGVRTTNGVYSARTPLVIVDNIERDLTFLDAYPIETITVIKDAAATAIYGMRGANGVVFVTTKRGTPGKTAINITQEVGFQNITRRPEFQNSYNYAQTFNRALYLDGKTQAFSDQEIEYYRQAVDGTLPQELKYKYVNTDWYDAVLRKNAPQTRTNVNISGGGKNVRYFTSFSYLRQEGFYNKKWTERNDWSTQHAFNRFNLRSNIDIDVTKRLGVSLDLGGRLDNVSEPNINLFWVYARLSESAPIYPVLNPNGSFAVDQRLNMDNPAAMVSNLGLRQTRRRNLYTNVKADLDLDFITKGLSAKGLVGFDFYNTFQIVQSQNWDGFYYNPDTHVYTRMHDGTAGLANPVASPRGMSYNVNMIGWLDYTRTFGDHHVNAMAVMRTYKNVVPGYTSSIRYLTYNTILNYTWREKLAVQGVATIMGSDNFRTADRYGFFPGATVSYDLAQEKFAQRSGFVDLLKPRISYGSAGQNELGERRYPYQGQFIEGSGYNFGTSQTYLEGVYEQSAGNTNNKWEESKMFNAGLDFDLWSSKLYGSFDAFKEWRTDILVPMSTVIDIVGVAQIPWGSNGKVETHGFEAMLGHRGKVGKVNYYVESNLTFNRNKIVAMDEVAPQYAYQAMTGHSIGTPLLYQFEKYFQSLEEIAASPTQEPGTKPGHGKYTDTNGDGTVNELDMVRGGYSNIPEFVAGLNVGFEWKGFSGRVLLMGEFNRMVDYRENVDASFFWQGTSTSEATKSWGYYTNDPYDSRNINAKYPRLTTERSHDRNTYLGSTLWWKSGDFISLRNVEVGYSLPKEMIAKVGMSQLRIYISGYNLMTFDKLKPLDPESPMSYVWGYPKSRVFSMGVNVGF